MKWPAIVALWFIAFTVGAIADDMRQPTPIGQNIGGGVHTTCHGSDRLYISAGSIAVIHNDTSCDSGG